MGTFSYFLGEMDIPEERREEFAQGQRVLDEVERQQTEFGTEK